MNNKFKVGDVVEKSENGYWPPDYDIGIILNIKNYDIQTRNEIIVYWMSTMITDVTYKSYIKKVL